MRPLHCPDDDDTRAVARALAGDCDAFRLLFERHRPPLVRYLASQTGDPLLAEDLAQDAFLAAFEHLPDLADGRPFAPWLYRIAQHRLRRHWRRRTIVRFVSLEAVTSAAASVAAAFRAEDHAAGACDHDLIRHTLATMSHGQRTALLLHCDHGFTAKEVAEISGASPAAAERQLTRAKEAFQERYRRLDARGGGDSTRTRAPCAARKLST